MIESISNANRRADLLYYIDLLASPQKQHRFWVLHDFPEGIVWDNFDNAIHFFFDDTELANEPESYIGNILRNKAEAHAIQTLTASLDLLLEKAGKNLSDEAYLQHPAWSQVVKAATDAKAVFSS